MLGIVLANVIPPQWGLGFAGVLALLGVMCSLLSERATWVAAGVAGAAAVAAYALPLKLNIVVAIAAAVAAGLVMETAERAWKRTGRPGDAADLRAAGVGLRRPQPRSHITPSSVRRVSRQASPGKGLSSGKKACA